MSKIDELILNIDTTKRNPNKDELWSIIKQTLELLNEINEDYKKFYEDSEGNPAILKSIEQKYNKIKKKYDNLFLADEQGVVKLEQLKKQINEIKEFHQELLEGNDEEDSIKDDIKESQEKITEFYNFLFEKEDNEEVTKEEKTKEAIKEITEFYKRLANADNGIREEIEDIYQTILDKYNGLYKKDEKGNNKISKLDSDIKKINNYKEYIAKDIEPFIGDIKDEISAKTKDIDELLEGATGGSLVEGFVQSKNEYNQIPVYKKFEGGFKNKTYVAIINILIFIKNSTIVLLDYVLFIFPLLISVFVFIQPEMLEKIVNNSSNHSSGIADYISKLNFWSRMIISLPLWWISWFGQRNISHNKRLAEEYNHKAQVTKMYLNFSSRKTHEAYPISDDAKGKLDDELIKTIKRHPGKVYGKDETMMDKIIQAISSFRGGKENKNRSKDEV